MRNTEKQPKSIARLPHGHMMEFPLSPRLTGQNAHAQGCIIIIIIIIILPNQAIASTPKVVYNSMTWNYLAAPLNE
jgi:hypothetical protein